MGEGALTRKAAVVSDQELFDLTGLLQPARSSWMQAVGHALGNEAFSVQLGIVILLVWRQGPRVSQRVLAARTGVTPGTLVSTIDQGEALGLLKRSAVEGDRRVKEIELLAGGKRCAQRIERSLTQLRRRLFGDLSPEDVRTAQRVLKLIEERALVSPRNDA